MLAFTNDLKYADHMANSIEALQDGEWHMVSAINGDTKRYPTEIIADIPVTLTVHQESSEPGFYPHNRNGQTHQVDFTGEVDDFLFLGDDFYANHGTISTLGKTASAALLPWPAPEFMYPGKDLGVFLKLWTPQEEEAGHVHLPFGLILKKDTLRLISDAGLPRV